MVSKNKKYCKVQLHEGTPIKEILLVLSKITHKIVIFCCPRNFPIIAETAFLKRLEKALKKNKKEVVFVCSKKYSLSILTAHKFPAFSKLPEEYADDEIVEIKSFFKQVVAQKNQVQKKGKDQKDSVKNADFESREIRKNESEKPIRGMLFFTFLCVILLLGTVFFWIAPSAVVQIKSKNYLSPITHNILITLPEAQINQENEKLPQVKGIFVETEVKGSEPFASTQKTYDITNASGIVSILNETNEPKFLLPSRLMTPGRLIFRTQNEVTVPPKRDGKAGQAQVKVIADAYDQNEKPIGNRGNIEAGTEMIFPALRKESRELYYAKANRGPLTGGSTLTHYFVGEEDPEISKSLLIESFRVRGTDFLQKEIEKRSEREGKKYVLLDQAKLLKSELLEFNFPDSLIGNEQQTFEVSGKMALSGVVFDESAIIKILEEKMKQNQDHRKKILQIDPHSIQYRVLDSEKFADEKWIKISVSLVGIETLDLDAQNAYAREWRDQLKKDIAGKTKEEARGLLTNHPEIESIKKIKISPFWNDTIPHIFEQIELRVSSQ